ncbi:RES family NAD+ phosphorylase [Alteromonas sp. ASW11-19]|uniref:RES family NAD+ phosphorylase n=1 Tax=Alteromonas salexigens TaxID=2982530 RepID=A0ABT2VNU3_9ALTE|nr:RES family NAD+ phosphorylase [Alteromonas salexigens]MCU7554143.1 RES family NAD+ phosphorylase [Alteromonas salexigens]
MTPREVVEKFGQHGEYAGSIWRIVETQEEAATYGLVDDLEEHALLEDIIDNFKPPYPDEAYGRHYLISTPFRYPPLNHGSRFGTRHEPSYYYASEEISTCLAEAAFYRFVFFDGMEAPFPHKVHSDHQLFSVTAVTASASDMTTVNDPVALSQLTSEKSYSFTQAVGEISREAGTQLIRYYSARCDQGVNVAIDNPAVIVSSQPEQVTPVLCEVLPEAKVLRFSLPKEFPVTFRIEQFLVEGALPYPAS